VLGSRELRGGGGQSGWQLLGRRQKEGPGQTARPRGLGGSLLREGQELGGVRGRQAR
jgi:hypothetical protein